MKRRMSFSKALAILEQHGIPVEFKGRLDPYGSLMWSVDGLLLDKDDVITYAEGVMGRKAV